MLEALPKIGVTVSVDTAPFHVKASKYILYHNHFLCELNTDNKVINKEYLTNISGVIQSYPPKIWFYFVQKNYLHPQGEALD
jgi:hypothetical protein